MTFLKIMVGVGLLLFLCLFFALGFVLGVYKQTALEVHCLNHSAAIQTASIEDTVWLVQCLDGAGP